MADSKIGTSSMRRRIYAARTKLRTANGGHLRRQLDAYEIEGLDRILRELYIDLRDADDRARKTEATTNPRAVGS